MVHLLSILVISRSKNTSRNSRHDGPGIQALGSRLHHLLARWVVPCQGYAVSLYWGSANYRTLVIRALTSETAPRVFTTLTYLCLRVPPVQSGNRLESGALISELRNSIETMGPFPSGKARLINH